MHRLILSKTVEPQDNIEAHILFIKKPVPDIFACHAKPYFSKSKCVDNFLL